MLDYVIKTDKKTQKKFIATSIAGKLLLTTPQLNKGTAFTEKERQEFGLLGKLPEQVETLKQQTLRAYLQFKSYASPLQQNRYLMNMHDKNEVLFYKLLEDNLEEMLPIIYTPTIGTAVQEFSREFREPRGLYISYPDINNIEKILANRSNPEIDLIVVTDGEGVLGIGDQGIGAIDIPIGKLAVYTLCGNINPLRTLPIYLDVGTNNEKLLKDPLYLGWRHKRIDQKKYDAFIANFVAAVKKRFPQVLLHWEDFGRENAYRNLILYREHISSFNDDIQGTAVVTLAAILAGVKTKKQKLSEQKIVIFGAGSAGTGIAEHIYLAMLREGASPISARQNFYLIDRQGLLTEYVTGLTPAQKPYAHNKEELASWQVSAKNKITLLEVINNIKPTILIGCSGVAGAFTEEAIATMAKYSAQPIILPLSNPTSNVEATPQDIINWTAGKALIATGSPFAPVTYNNKKIDIPQCNNALAFPGIGLGVIAVKAKAISDNMLWKACEALYLNAPILKQNETALLPAIGEAKKIAKKIAYAVGKQAILEKLSSKKVKDINSLIADISWEAKYLPFKYMAEK